MSIEDNSDGYPTNEFEELQGLFDDDDTKVDISALLESFQNQTQNPSSPETP